MNKYNAKRFQLYMQKLNNFFTMESNRQQSMKKAKEESVTANFGTNVVENVEKEVEAKTKENKEECMSENVNENVGDKFETNVNKIVSVSVESVAENMGDNFEDIFAAIMMENIIDLNLKVIVEENVQQNTRDHVNEIALNNIRENIPKDDIADLKENVEENFYENGTENIKENLENVTKEMVEKVEGDVEENMDEFVDKHFSEIFLENRIRNMIEYSRENIAKITGEHLPETVPENVSGKVQENVSENIPENTPESEPENVKENKENWEDVFEDGIYEAHFQRNSKLAESSKRLKSQIWSSVVTILLVRAKNLPLAEDGNILNEAHIKFRLRNEKYKSKSSWKERWLEQFDLHLFDEEQNLELSLWNRNSLFGKANIDLSAFQRETTHGIWKPFDDCPGEVFLMLTISGTTALETISDLKSFVEDPRETELVRDRYRWHRSLQNLRDVGHLTVKVFGATGLAAADIGGKSDPFCVLELGNARLQTQTEYKTLTPTWNKIFTFNVKDMTEVLEITVYDEDRDHRVEFLGKLMIPLLRIRNGVKRWYTLKDKNLCIRAKGMSPQILLEMTVVWSELRAVCGVLKPKEEKLIQQEAKFKRQLFLRNVNRLKVIIMEIVDAARYVQSCFEWESPVRSTIAFVLWCLACWYGNIETVPLVLLLVILKNWLVRLITGSATDAAARHYDYDDDDDDDDDKEKEEKKSIKERLQAIQEVSQTVQNTIGYLASLAESTINTFNFSVPELTYLAVILLIGVTFVLHFVPIRYLLLCWGLIKFSRRILRPNTIPNNELLDFLSRVPDNEEMNQYRELPTSAPTEQARSNPKKKNKASTYGGLE